MDFSDLGDIGKLVSYVIPVIIFLLINVFFRKQQEQQRKQTVIRKLLSEIKYNQKLVEASSLQWQLKKFKTGTWKSNKKRLDYVAPSLYSTLAEACEIAEEFNLEIGAAKKHQSASYMAGIQMDRLTKPLAGSERGLEEWLLENKGKKEPSKKSRGISG